MLHQQIWEITVFNIPYPTYTFQPLTDDLMLSYYYVKCVIMEINYLQVV